MSKLQMGDKNHFFGKKHTEETKDKMKLSQKDNHLKGDKHPMWKGGIGTKTRRKYAPRPMPEQCEVCGAFGKDFKKGLVLDHDHKTGKFRGWLCTRCNCSIGMVNDNTETLGALIDYLLKSREN